MSLSAKTFRAALPESLRDHVTESQVEALIGYSFVEVFSVNGCTLAEIQSAVSALRTLGIITHPWFEKDSSRLLKIVFLRK
jgi:hypothetical protein